MKRLILIVLAVTSNIAIAAESGAYLGGHVGYGNANTKINIGADTLDGLGSGGIAGGGFVGYQFGLEKTAFAVEVDYSLADIDSKLTLNGGTTTAGLDSLLSFSGKLAYSVTDSAAVFLRGGYVIGDFDAGGDLLTEGEKEGGFVLGFGMEIGLSENLSLYGEYQHQNFGRFDKNVDGKTKINAFRAGFRYQF